MKKICLTDCSVRHVRANEEQETYTCIETEEFGLRFRYM